jgi:hypothetical protein
MFVRSMVPFAAAIALILGLLVYASPSKNDQLWGKLIMLYGVAMFGTLLLPSGRELNVVRWLFVAPPLLFLAYCALKQV